MSNFFIVCQETKNGAVPVKVIGNAPNTENKPNRNGDVNPFIRIPPIVRLFIGNQKWNSPSVMPASDDPDQPTVWKLTLNPRTNNFNLHYPERLDVNPITGERKMVKEASGSLSMNGMHALLVKRIGEDMAHQIIVMMVQATYSAVA